MSTLTTLLLFYMASKLGACYDRMCAPIQNFPSMIEGKHIPISHSFYMLSHTSVLKCVVFGIKSSACKSVSFHLPSGNCYLFHQNFSNYEHQMSSEFFSTDIQDWPGHLADSCENHSCPRNTLCKSTSVDGYTCEIIGCFRDTSLDLGDNQTVWKIGYAANRFCDAGFHASTTSICQENGQWSSSVCLFYPRNCSEVRECNDLYADGEYFLFYSNGGAKWMKVYCYFMSTNAPKEYITLPFGNLVSGTKHESCEESKLEKNSFSKIRLLINDTTKDLTVDVSEKTFATYADSFDYGVPQDCLGRYSSCASRGHFLINLADTSFRLPLDTEWVAHKDGIIYNVFVHGDVVRGVCGSEIAGHCGGCSVDGAMRLEIKGNYTPNFDSAILPHCNV